MHLRQENMKMRSALARLEQERDDSSGCLEDTVLFYEKKLAKLESEMTKSKERQNSLIQQRDDASNALVEMENSNL